MCDEHRALGRPTQRRLERRHHRVSLENEVVDALKYLAGSRQAQAASLPDTQVQSSSLKVGAKVVALAGPPLDGVGWLSGTLSELRVARGYTDTPVNLAPLDVGALALPPRGFQPRGLDELVGHRVAREIVQRLSAMLLPKASQVEAQPVTVA